LHPPLSTTTILKNQKPSQKRGAIMTKHIAIAFAAMFMLSACGPMGPVPGVVLGGETQTPPADFAVVQQHDLIQIETQMAGMSPQVQNIWGVGLGDAVIAIGEPGSGWRARLDDDPNTRVRVGNAVYELTAAPINEEEKQAALDVYVAKYGPQIPEAVGRDLTLEDFAFAVRMTAR
jgi:hypothetical protein